MATVNTLTVSNHHSGLVSVDGRTYPLKSADINARAEGGIAATTLKQRYENPYAEALEVLYTLPLPADGAVTGYTIRIGERVIRGEVRKREEAKEEYRKALLEGRTAGLLEQERADTFSQKLGSLPPGATVTVDIEILHPLAFLTGTDNEGACWEYRFPTVAGVRYEGAEGRVPDADRLDVDRAADETPVRLEASLRIADGSAGDIRPHSPDQQIRVQDSEDGAAVQLEQGMRLDRDLVVRWSAGKQETGVRVTEGKGLPGDDGRYMLITLTPPKAVEWPVARDLTLLIDASGSMDGEPIEQAKAVAAEMLHSLDPGDRFEILAFSNNVRRLVSGPADASEKNIKNALKELWKLQAGGATEMRHALIEALKPLRPDSQRQIVLLTDGYIGFESEVIGEISRRLVPGARVHAVGVGSAPNRTLTREAARAGRGVEIIIGLREDARVSASRLLQATVRPVLTDILVEGCVSCAPRKPSDVFEGRPALIFAEVKSKGGPLTISGKVAGQSSHWTRTLEIPPLGTLAGDESSCERGYFLTPIPIGALFGREAVQDAEIDLAACRGREPGTIENRIESLGLRHRIPSRMTSLVAISEDVTVDPRNPRRRERLPVEVPAGVSAEGAGLIRGGPLVMASQLSDTGSFDVLLAEAPSLLGRKRHMPRFLGPSRSMPIYQPIVIERARVLRIDDQVLIFEFEAPVDGFLLPKDRARVQVRFDDGAKASAKVLESESSRPGPYQQGLTIRLALRLEGKLRWDHGSAMLDWEGRLLEGKEIRIDVAVHVDIGRF